MVERGDQRNAPRFDHGVAEHVAGHVADADSGGGRVGCDADLVEVAQHRLPRPLRRDAHLFMVVAIGAARRERIAQPEAAPKGELVGDIAERRRAFVCGDHEVRVVRVVPAHARGTDDARRLDVVGEIEQPGDEELITGDHFGVDGRPVGGAGQALAHETALGSGGDDHRVLGDLRLHQLQDLGAIVVEAVRPTDATARDAAGAQVHTFGARRVDEDLVSRARQRQAGYERRVELEREVGQRAAGVVAAVEVGADRGVDTGTGGAQNDVVVE